MIEGQSHCPENNCRKDSILILPCITICMLISVSRKMKVRVCATWPGYGRLTWNANLDLGISLLEQHGPRVWLDLDVKSCSWRGTDGGAAALPAEGSTLVLFLLPKGCSWKRIRPVSRQPFFPSIVPSHLSCRAGTRGCHLHRLQSKRCPLDLCNAVAQPLTSWKGIQCVTYGSKR